MEKFRIVLSLMTFLLITEGAQGQVTGLLPEETDFITSKDCTSNASVCNPTTERCVATTGDTTIKQCRCNAETFWKKEGNLCVLRAGLNEKCGNQTGQYTDVKCVLPGSECRVSTTSLTETGMRCLCKAGYTDVDHAPDTHSTYSVIPPAYKRVCGMILKTTATNNCNECKADVSKCFVYPNSNSTTTTQFPADSVKKDGCRCDVSFSGDMCSMEHVRVGCDFGNKTMQICYTAHSDVNSTDVSLSVVGQAANLNCVAPKTALTENRNMGLLTCNAGSYLFNLNMTICDTKLTKLGDKQRYSNILTVPTMTLPEQHVFAVYCESDLKVTKTIGTAVQRFASNDRGESKTAEITFSILDVRGENLGSSPSIRSDDKIRFVMELTDDDSYAAVLVETCIASPYNDVQSSKGENYNSLLYSDGCPAPKSKLDFTKSAYNTKLRKMSELMTIPWPIIGNTQYIHCKVRVCLRGIEEDCEQRVCTATSRKKRAATDFNEEDVAMEITLVDARAAAQGGSRSITLTTANFSIVVAVLIALVVAAVVAIIILYLKLRARGDKVDDTVEMTQKQPQRFALPRISRDHMRI